MSSSSSNQSYYRGTPPTHCGMVQSVRIDRKGKGFEFYKVNFGEASFGLANGVERKQSKCRLAPSFKSSSFQPPVTMTSSIIFAVSLVLLCCAGMSSVGSATIWSYVTVATCITKRMYYSYLSAQTIITSF
ncbi:hypothetical protein Tco_1127684 [Tanacetum coccineum]